MFLVWTYVSNTSRYYIAYCFTSKPGFSKVGSYTGNGSASGPMVQTGFEPAFLMIKEQLQLDSWYMCDNKRNTSNPRSKVFSNTQVLKLNQLITVNFYSNGFQVNTIHADSMQAGGQLTST